MKFAAAMANSQKLAGPHTLEIAHFDNKGTAQESVAAFRLPLDQGYRYFFNGGSSANYAALLDAVNKHNARNPGKEVLLLSHSTADPELSNAKCSFWSFIYHPSVPMMANAVTTEIARDPKIKKLYVLNQNFPYGQSISRFTKDMLKQKRPDLEIVGDDLVPLEQVKDFTPYIAKVKASGADAVTSGNWGVDLTLLVKAAANSGLNIPFFTYLAHGLGIPTAIGAAGEGRLRNISPTTTTSRASRAKK
jgi:branched-chain amino acid transport system substrate-binding protein